MAPDGGLGYGPPMNTEMLLVLSTLPDEAAARSLATTLVEEGLAACVNILPSLTSIYRWQGKVQHEQECLLLIKVAARAYETLELRLRALHPYELPEVVAVPVHAGLADYIQWVQENTGLTT